MNEEKCIVINDWKEDIEKKLAYDREKQYFQPHLGSSQISDVKDEVGMGHLAVYFSLGQDAKEVSYKGVITEFYYDVIPQHIKEYFEKAKKHNEFEKDKKVIAVEELRELPQPIKFSKFIKVSDNKPIIALRRSTICFKPKEE